MDNDPNRVIELSNDGINELVEKKVTCPFIGSAVAQGKLLVRNDASNPLASLEDVRKLGNTGVAILEICSWRLPAAIMRS